MDEQLERVQDRKETKKWINQTLIVKWTHQRMNQKRSSTQLTNIYQDNVTLF